jgi:hypothetical protein
MEIEIAEREKGSGHRYLRKVDCSRHTSLHKIYFNSRASSRHIGKTRQVGMVNEQATKTRQMGWVNVPALTTNIFAASTNRTNIHNKTDSMHL